MLFYIFLFALQQTSMRQQAWLKSFLIWLVMEIFLIGTAVVYLTHILIPSFTFKDVKKIKNYLMQSFRNRRKHKKRTEGDSDASTPFNTASFLFVSYRLAQLYPDLLESQVIMNFSTTWPVQSYKRQKDITTSYKGSFSAIKSGVATLAIYLITSSIDLPPAIHDMTIGMASSVSIGYCILIHLQLYQLYPVLVIIPTIVIGVLVHFFMKANKSKKDVGNEILPLLEEPESDDTLDAIRSIENIDTLQSMLHAKDKKDRRERLNYQWAITDELPVVAKVDTACNYCEVEASLPMDKNDERPLLLIKDSVIEGPQSERGNIDAEIFALRPRLFSTDSGISRRTPPSVQEDDWPTSSHGSSLLPSPAVSADNISSPIDSQSSVSLDTESRLESPLNQINRKRMCQLDDEEDAYSMPSKQSAKSESVGSYAVTNYSGGSERSSRVFDHFDIDIDIVYKWDATEDHPVNYLQKQQPSEDRSKKSQLSFNNLSRSRSESDCLSAVDHHHSHRTRTRSRSSAAFSAMSLSTWVPSEGFGDSIPSNLGTSAGTFSVRISIDESDRDDPPSHHKILTDSLFDNKSEKSLNSEIKIEEGTGAAPHSPPLSSATVSACSESDRDEWNSDVHCRRSEPVRSTQSLPSLDRRERRQQLLVPSS
jgi:hypothetical protein